VDYRLFEAEKLEQYSLAFFFRPVQWQKNSRYLASQMKNRQQKFSAKNIRNEVSMNQVKAMP